MTVWWVEQQPAAAPAPGVAGFAEGDSPGVKIFKWPSLAAADVGEWLPVSGYTEASMAIMLEGGGAFGDSTIAMQCAFEYGTPTKTYIQQDPQGNNITGRNTEEAEQFLLSAQQIRPKLTGTTGTGISVLLRLSTTRAGRRG